MAHTNIMPLREQESRKNIWREKRLNTLLPVLMKEAGLDMWIVVSREDHQDPVISTLMPPALTGDEAMVLPPTCNRIIVILTLTEAGIRRQQISALQLKEYENVWDQSGEGQWECLARIVRETRPKRIGINISETFAHADGLSHSQHGMLIKALGEYAALSRSAEQLAVSWLETRIEEELDAYPGLIELSNTIIAEAFSRTVITPGLTSIEDVAWFIRQRIRDLGLSAWFRPMAAINRQGKKNMEYSGVIQAGDMLFCDVGIRYLGLVTDSQQQAYVLRPGESQAPAGLVQAVKNCNRLQDIVAAEFQAGRTGNDILAAALAQCQAEGLQAYISTHPLGYFGHGPGTPVGVWDKQGGVPGRGDLPLRANTCYALELCTVQEIPEWDRQRIAMNLEETIIFTGGKAVFSPGRRTEFHLIGAE